MLKMDNDRERLGDFVKIINVNLNWHENISNVQCGILRKSQFPLDNLLVKQLLKNGCFLGGKQFLSG